jgi:hypothetical protein
VPHRQSPSVCPKKSLPGPKQKSTCKFDSSARSVGTRICGDVFQKRPPRPRPGQAPFPCKSSEADARTRTGDPFITSDGPVSAPVRSSHLRPLLMRDSADWPTLEVTGEDNLVDGWWTSGDVVILENSEATPRVCLDNRSRVPTTSPDVSWRRAFASPSRGAKAERIRLRPRQTERS